MRKDIFVLLIFLAVGLGLAYLLGLDQSAGWGRTRIALLSLGSFVLLCVAGYIFFTNKFLCIERKIRSFFEKYLSENRVAHYLKEYSFVFPYIATVFLLYVWFASAGTWTSWISPTRYYANLAKGFQSGTLYTPTKPPSELLILPDPYDYRARDLAGIKPPIDISYYNGRYYLYWGPLPALLLVLLSPLYSGRVGDLQLVFTFVCGIFLMQSLVIIFMWDRFFCNQPKWMLSSSMLLIGLSSPVTFMLANFSGARIYEAAISGSQFFLVSGLLAALASVSDSFRAWKLMLASILWMLAIGTRQTVLLSVMFMVFMLVYGIIEDKNTSLQNIKKIFVLILPLVVGFFCMGWYNWARFGSVTETGLYYQMNHGFVHYHTDELISVRYVLQNLYNYLMMPFSITHHFPFLTANIGRTKEILPFSTSRSSIYGSQVITGVLSVVPFVIFAVIPLIMSIFKERSPRSGMQNLFNWIVVTLGGSSLASFGFLMLFFWAAMRYAEDFMPSLIILSVIGFWQGYSLLSHKLLARKVYVAFGLLLASITIVVSTLLAISVNDARFVILQYFSSL